MQSYSYQQPDSQIAACQQLQITAESGKTREVPRGSGQTCVGEITRKQLQTAPELVSQMNDI